MAPQREEESLISFFFWRGWHERNGEMEKCLAVLCSNCADPLEALKNTLLNSQRLPVEINTYETVGENVIKDG